VNIRSIIRFAAGLSGTAILALCASSTLQPGKADLKSAGALAFGPDNILFVGDTPGAAIWALDVQDRPSSKPAASIEIKGVNEKIAALLGTAPDQILINDTAVSPVSKNVYMSVSRGRGPDAAAVILRVDAAGNFSEVPLDNIAHSSVKLVDAPAAAANGRQVETITAIAYIDGNVVVAGLSNEEFSSTLRSSPIHSPPLSRARASRSITGRTDVLKRPLRCALSSRMRSAIRKRSSPPILARRW
jgi:hypothetical protein